MNGQLDPVWKALSDPTRRALLDMMRGGPRTTGELCGEFDMSRFGVMKHLTVLTDAGLVVVRRHGRQRLNHLNAVPIRQIYERWVGKFAGREAAGLLQLKQLAEGPTMSVTQQQNGKAVDSFTIAQEVTINAPREKVWQALTRSIGQWWPHRPHAADQSKIALDVRVGGDFTETWGDGEGAIWGTIVYLVKGKRLTLSGVLGMREHPVTSLYTYELEDQPSGTLVKLTHEVYGHIDEQWPATYDDGWKQVLGTFLKRFVEEGKTAAELEAEAG